MNVKVKFAGHTMGAPGRDIDQCIELFREIGFDGIEIRVAPNGQIDSETITDREAERIYQKAQETGIEICSLVSYYQDFVGEEERQRNLHNIKRVIEIASILHCPIVRVYGGVEPQVHPEFWFCDVWSRTVSGLREVADYAEKHGIRLAIETHAGSLTVSIRDTIRMLEDVDMPNVGILFDYAWVEAAGVEYGREAVKLAKNHIFHVHVKDWILHSRVPFSRTTCLLGEGTIAWDEVLDELKQSGYEGYISVEYEKFWHPEELPEPEIGMKRDLTFLKERFDF